VVRGLVSVGCVLGLVSSGHLAELFVDLAGAFAGFGELGGVGEGLAEVVSGVGDLAAGSFDAGEGVLLAGLEVVEAVSSRVIRPVGSAVPRSRAASWSVPPGTPSRMMVIVVLPRHCSMAAASGKPPREPGVDVPAAHAVQFAGLSPQQLFQVLASLGSLRVSAVTDGHGEGVAVGVVPPGDRDVDVSGQLGQVPDVGLVAFDGVLQRGLVAVVGMLGALEPGQGSVGLGFVHQQWVAGGQGLDLAERQGGVPDVADLTGIEAAVHDLADEPGLAFQYRFARNIRRSFSPSSSAGPALRG
jgi:hypothetical protein